MGETVFIVRILFFYFVVSAGASQVATHHPYPSCLFANFTWDDSRILETLSNIETPESCQGICKEKECSTFSWSNEVPFMPSICILFINTSPQDTIPSEVSCVSGPHTCSCDASGQCEVVDDNAISSIFVLDIETCRDHCQAEPSCAFYNFYDDESPLRNLCILFKSCQVKLNSH